MLPFLLFLLFVPTISMSTTPSSITPHSSVIEHTFDQQATRWEWTIEQTIYLTNVLFQQIEDETVGELLYKYLDPHHGKPAIVKFKKTQCRVADVQPISRHPFRRRVQAKKATPLSQSPKSKSNEHRRRLAEHQWTLAIASQDITENIGAIVSQNEWTLNIAAQAITEKVGVTVTQESNTGILKTALSNEWTLAITSQEINEISGVAVTQGDATGTLKTALTGASTSVVIETASDVTFLNSTNVLIGGDEFTFDITAQGIKESAGVTVTQGSKTGTLKTALSNEWTLAVLNTPTIAETAGVTISQGSICSPASSNGACTSISAPANQAACDPQSIGSCAGGGGTQCTSVASGPKATCIGTNDDASQACAWTATNLCTITDKVVGTLKTTLSGGATSVVIETASGVTILDSADVNIGETVLVHANIGSSTGNLDSKLSVGTALVYTAKVGAPLRVRIETNAATSNNELVFASAHGMVAGTAVTYTDNGKATIDELTDSNTYYVLDGTSTSTMKLAATSGGTAITMSNGWGGAGGAAGNMISRDVLTNGKTYYVLAGTRGVSYEIKLAATLNGDEIDIPIGVGDEYVDVVQMNEVGTNQESSYNTFRPVCVQQAAEFKTNQAIKINAVTIPQNDIIEATQPNLAAPLYNVLPSTEWVTGITGWTKGNSYYIPMDVSFIESTFKNNEMPLFEIKDKQLKEMGPSQRIKLIDLLEGQNIMGADLDQLEDHGESTTPNGVPPTPTVPLGKQMKASLF